MALGKETAQGICSARECTNPAEYALLWSNPKIHTGRIKTWLSCIEHRDFLHQYVRYRNFPVEIVTFDELKRREGKQ